MHPASASSWRRPTWSSRCGCRSRHASRSRATRAARAPAARDRARAAGSRRDDRAARRAAVPRSSSAAPAEYSLNTQSAEDFPQLPVPSGSVVRRRPCGVRRHRQPRRPGGVEGRVAAGADRRAGGVRRGHRDHGRDRQLPAVGEGVGAAGSPPATRRRSCRRGRWPRSRGSRRGDAARGVGAGEPGAVRDGRRLAVGAPHRRPVPELPAAAAADVRARDRDLQGGAAGRDPAHLADGAAQPAACG